MADSELNMEREDRDKLIQILSELTAVRNDIAELKSEQKVSRADKVRLSLLESRTDLLDSRLREFEEKYVTQDQFEPVRRVFWIIVGVIVTGIGGGFLLLIN